MMDSSNDVGFACSTNEPRRCAAGCGFFGSAETQGFCSKCYKDKHVQKASVFAGELKFSSLEIRGADIDLKSEAIPKSDDANQSAAAAKKRCDSCNKKLGILGFMCRCKGSFCKLHRLPEAHACQFDYKNSGKNVIKKENPVIKADKITDRI